VGVYFNSVSNNTVRGFSLDPTSFDPNARLVAGAVLRNGAENRLGGVTWAERNEFSAWNGWSAASDLGILIAGASAVTAELQLPPGMPITTQGIFPIRSDNFVVGQAATHPVDDWRALHFPDDLDDPTISGPDADPDNDNIPNLFEYLRDSDPRVAESGNGIVFRFESGQLVIEFERAQSATGVRLGAEGTRDLNSWLGGQPLLEETPGISDLGNGRERITFRTANGAADAGLVAVRLTAEREL